MRLPNRVDQKEVMQNLLDQGIATRRGIMCSHREAPYSTESSATTCVNPNSRRIIQYFCRSMRR